MLPIYLADVLRLGIKCHFLDAESVSAVTWIGPIEIRVFCVKTTAKSAATVQKLRLKTVQFLDAFSALFFQLCEPTLTFQYS